MSSGLLLNILNGITDPIVVKNRQHQWVFANKAFCEWIQPNCTSIIGGSDADFFAPDDLDRVSQHDESAFVTGVSQEHTIHFIREGQGDDYSISTALIHDDANSVFLVRQMRRSPHFHDQRQAEIALHESEQQFRALYELTGDAVLLMDAARGYFDCNAAAVKLFGCESKEQLCSKSPCELSPVIQPSGETSDSVAVKRMEIAFQQGYDRFEWLHCRLDKTEFLAEVLLNMIELSGKSIAQVVIRDITERKQTEATLRQSEAQLRQQAQDLKQTLRELQRTQSQLIQSEKMSSLGQLVAGIAHEINNPVSFIYGNLSHAEGYIHDLLQLLRGYQREHPHPSPALVKATEAVDLEFLRTDLPRLLDSIKSGAERIREIIRSLRNFSRLDEAEVKSVDIHEGLDSTLMILQSRLKAYGDRPEIQVIKEYGNLPPIECHPGSLNQVFLNILSNAIDALKGGFQESEFRSKSESQHSPTIWIYTQLIDRDRITIRIADNGMGMSQTVQQRLFDPFFTTKPIGKGTGLGLSVSYQIVTEQHQGALRCTSKLSQGAEFVIELPLK